MVIIFMVLIMYGDKGERIYTSFEIGKEVYRSSLFLS